MKILLANKYFYRRGGAENSMFLLNDLLTMRGHEVAHLSMQDPRNELSAWSDYFVSNVELSAAGSARNSVKAIQRMFYSREVRDCTRALVQAFRPDVAVLNNVYHQLGPTLIRELAQARVPMILLVRDSKLICPAYTSLRGRQPCLKCAQGAFFWSAVHGCGGSRANGVILALESYWQHAALHTWSKMSAVVAPSDFYGRLIQNQQPAMDVRVIRNAIETIAPAKRAAERPYIGFAGRLSSEKGIDTLLEAAANCPEIMFRIAGEGPELTRLRELQRQSGCANVHFLGGMGQQALELEMRTWRVAVIPSIWFENCPRVALEALRLGIPLIGSDIGGIPELVEGHGVVVAPGDSGDLARAMVDLWTDPDRCNEFGSRGRDYIARECAPAIHADRFEEVLRAVATRKVVPV